MTRQERKELGICILCGREPAMKNRTLGKSCAREKSAHYFEKQKRARQAAAAGVIVAIAMLCSPAHPQTADRAFFTVAAFHAASIALDGYTTAKFVNASHDCAENGATWLYSERPTPARLSLAMLGEFAVGELIGYILKREHAHVGRVPLWTLPAIANSAPHLVGGIRALEICR